jgi:tetratricopeptide (TPR) repeat protein
MLWPAGLYLFHPNPSHALPWPQVLGAALLLAAISLWVARAARRRPYLLVGWLWYLGTLVPVLGLVQVGFAATTDHYTYIPLIGLFIVIAFGTEELVGRLPPTFSRALVAAPLLACALLSRQQLRYWQSTVTVWERELQFQPDIAMAHAFLAVALEARGRADEAEAHYARATELDKSWKGHLDRGLQLERAGNLYAAWRELEIVLLTAPHNRTALEHLAAQSEARHDIGQAITHYSTLAHLRPTDAGPEYHLGLLFRERHDPAAARAHLQRTLERDPAFAEAKQLLDALPAN